MSKPKNERALTAEEKVDFMTQLARLCREYGVDLDLDVRGYEWSEVSLDITDHYGYTLFSCSSFDQGDCDQIIAGTYNFPFA